MSMSYTEILEGCHVVSEVQERSDAQIFMDA